MYGCFSSIGSNDGSRSLSSVTSASGLGSGAGVLSATGRVLGSLSLEGAVSSLASKKSVATGRSFGCSLASPGLALTQVVVVVLLFSGDTLSTQERPPPAREDLWRFG
eukprot:Lithocolla_globosa_v1_NODE_191_length_5320_cov_8.118139.p7 type:complete len:108 gc:universal NODE_191_length_5320_cov_8.118139:979-656(-)